MIYRITHVPFYDYWRMERDDNCTYAELGVVTGTNYLPDYRDNERDVPVEGDAITAFSKGAALILDEESTWFWELKNDVV